MNEEAAFGRVWMLRFLHQGDVLQCQVQEPLTHIVRNAHTFIFDNAHEVNQALSSRTQLLTKSQLVFETVS